MKYFVIGWSSGKALNAGNVSYGFIKFTTGNNKNKNKKQGRDGLVGKELATMFCDLSLIPGTHMVEGKERLLQVVLWPLSPICAGVFWEIWGFNFRTGCCIIPVWPQTHYEAKRLIPLPHLPSTRTTMPGLWLCWDEPWAPYVLDEHFTSWAFHPRLPRVGAEAGGGVPLLWELGSDTQCMWVSRSLGTEVLGWPKSDLSRLNV